MSHEHKQRESNAQRQHQKVFFETNHIDHNTLSFEKLFVFVNVCCFGEQDGQKTLTDRQKTSIAGVIDPLGKGKETIEGSAEGKGWTRVPRA